MVTSISQEDLWLAESFWEDCGKELLIRLSVNNVPFTSYPPRVHMQRTRFPVFVNMYIVISVENIARDGLRITRRKEFVGKLVYLT